MIFFIFLKKEIKETLKTSKVFILFAVYVFFSIFSTVTAKYINQILLSAGANNEVMLPEPTYYDSLQNFFKNYYSICILVLIFVFMDVIVNEKKSGTIYLILTKGFKRGTVIWAKYISVLVIFSIAYIGSVLVDFLYTKILFNSFDLKSALFSAFCLWIFGSFTASSILLSSTISKGVTGAALISLAIYMINTIFSSIKIIGDFLPGKLYMLAGEIVNGTRSAIDALVPLASTILLSIILLFAAVQIFEKQEL